MKRLFPCPYHDISGTERWLEAMAAKGLRLSGIRLGLAEFEACPPLSLRYIVLPAPHEEEVIHEPEGWSYVASRSGDKDYRIFSTVDPLLPTPARPEQDLAATVKRSTTLFGFMSVLVISMVCDDYAQQPLRGDTIALDAALIALLLDRACALYLLNQAQSGKAGKLSGLAYQGSLALRLLSVTGFAAAAAAFLLGI